MYYNCVTSNDDCDLSQEELMKRLQSLAFAINDLALYLDTHPNDEKAIKLHTDYANQYRTAYDRYEREYGPLSIFCPCNSWRWIEGPWPSFSLGYYYLSTN